MASLISQCEPASLETVMKSAGRGHPTRRTPASLHGWSTSSPASSTTSHDGALRRTRLYRNALPLVDDPACAKEHCMVLCALKQTCTSQCRSGRLVGILDVLRRDPLLARRGRPSRFPPEEVMMVGCPDVSGRTLSLTFFKTSSGKKIELNQIGFRRPHPCEPRGTNRSLLLR